MRMKQHVSDLGDLAIPGKELPLASPNGWSYSSLKHMLESMIQIRLVEEAIAALDESGEAKCPCHLGIGQEAVAVGVAQVLQKTDRAFGAHRSHSHFLAMGGTVDSLMHEVLGKVDGCSKGMGGSMHLFGQEFGFYGSVPIVAGTVPLAVGAGMAAKMDGGNDLAVAYFGDGASEEGVVHESLNLASQFNLPVLFVCENNLYSSHLDISQRQPSDSIARFAEAHRIEHKIIDGNDSIGVANTCLELSKFVRSGKGPAFLEAVTYRWRGHVGPDENIDVGVRRKPEDLVAWKKRDPIQRLVGIMKSNFVEFDEGVFEEVETEIRSEIQAALTRARSAPYPGLSQNLDSVYSQKGG